MTDDKMTFTDWLRKRGAGIVTPLAKGLAKLGLTPNMVTWIGFLLTAGVGVVLGFGYLRLGGVLLWVTSAMDALDGTLARTTGKVTRFGAFLDSTLDRVSDGALLAGLLVYFADQGELVPVYLCFAAMLGSVMVSYTRARAEGAGFECKVGIATRVERIVLLGLGLLLGFPVITLWVLAIATWFTVGQRMWHVWRADQSY